MRRAGLAKASPTRKCWHSDRVILTLNRRHFIRLHRDQSDHCGIIVCTFDPDFAALALRIHEAVSERPGLPSQLIRINRPGE